jgi:hypothetical protein
MDNIRKRGLNTGISMTSFTVRTVQPALSLTAQSPGISMGSYTEPMGLPWSGQTVERSGGFRAEGTVKAVLL